MLRNCRRLSLSLTLIVLAAAGLTAGQPEISSAGSARVYLAKGDKSFGQRLVYRPKVISLGSTGYLGELHWRGWNTRSATGRGWGFATSASVPDDAPRNARVRVFGRKRCVRHLVYTRVTYRVWGYRRVYRLTCRTGVHP